MTVIVPGGRFREFYYWDSYWIIRGLLHSEMYETAKGMLENFLSIINRFGFIPNGGRIYYSERSQPPLLAAMIKAYVDATNDNEFMKTATPILEREFYFFYNNHMVDVEGVPLATYGDKSTGPRPESYLEDILTAKDLESDQEKEDMWSELKAGAESGMDFSSRWFIKNGTNDGDLRDLKCRSIVPVELNAILYWNANIISQFYLKSGQPKKSVEFEERAQQMYDVCITRVFLLLFFFASAVGAAHIREQIETKPKNNSIYSFRQSNKCYGMKRPAFGWTMI